MKLALRTALLLVACSGRTECVECQTGGAPALSSGGNAGNAGGPTVTGGGGVSAAGRGHGGEGNKLCQATPGSIPLSWIFAGNDAGASAGGASGNHAEEGGASAVGGEAGAGEAGGPAAPASGCWRTPSLVGEMFDTRCRGEAVVTASDGHGTELRFDDGSLLYRENSPFRFPVASRVHVDFTDGVFLDCPVCGYRTYGNIEVREAEDDALLYYSHGGELPQTVPPAVMQDIFGEAELTFTPGSCSYPVEFGCSKGFRRPLEAMISVEPPQLFTQGRLSFQNARGERFELWISKSEDELHRLEDCSDGQEPHVNDLFEAWRAEAGD